MLLMMSYCKAEIVTIFFMKMMTVLSDAIRKTIIVNATKMLPNLL